MRDASGLQDGARLLATVIVDGKLERCGRHRAWHLVLDGAQWAAWGPGTHGNHGRRCRWAAATADAVLGMTEHPPPAGVAARRREIIEGLFHQDCLTVIDEGTPVGDADALADLAFHRLLQRSSPPSTWV